jgi:hypothetical protein
MKFFISLLLVFLIFSINTQAQYNDSLWQVENNTTMVRSMAIFDSQYASDIKPYITQSAENTFTLNWENDSVYGITYTKAAGEINWAAIQFNTTHWEGDTTNNFTKNTDGENIKHNVAHGYSVNISQKEKRQVTFQIQTSHDITFLGTLKDIQGKVGNAVEAKVTVQATTGGTDISDDSKWQTVTMAWDESANIEGDYGSIIDGWSETWWGRSNNGLRNTEHPLDSSKIIGFNLLPDPSGFYTADVEKTFFIKNIVIGKYDKNNAWEVYDNTVSNESDLLISPLKSISINEIEAGAQYSCSLENSILQVDFNNSTAPNNSESINMNFASTQGSSGNVFVSDLNGLAQAHDTIIGYSVDMSAPENRLIRLQVQSTDNIALLAQLVDINGKVSNSFSPEISINATTTDINTSDESKWKTITFAWDNSVTADISVNGMIDENSTHWWGTDISTDRDNLHTLDSSRIIGIRLIIDPLDEGSINDNKTVFFRKINLGNQVTYPIPNVELESSDKKHSFSLSNYYYGSGITTYAATSSNADNISTKIQTPVVSVTAENVCDNFTETITAQYTDADGTHEQAFTVSYTMHEIESEEIGLITTNETGDRFNVIWERPTSTNILGYNVYDMTNAQETFLSLHAYNTTSVYVDPNTENITKKSYKITVVDICDEETEKSPIHTSVELTNDENNLKWSKYVGRPVLKYEILGGTHANNEFTVIGEVAPHKITYLGSNSYSKYRIKAVFDTTFNPTELKEFSYPINYSLSNIVSTSNSIENVDNTITVYPTISTESIHVNSTTEITSYSISNALGTEVITNNTYQPEISISNLDPGLYVISFFLNGELIGSQQFVKQ